MILVISAVFTVFIFFPSEIAAATRDGLLMCVKSVIPSLFPFMVISKMLVMSERIDENNFIFNRTGKIFKISNAGVWAFMLGLFCGYPVGAKTVAELLSAKKISKKEADRLLLFCNNAGPAFVIATVGGMFFNDVKTGVIIYLSHILSSVLIGLAASFMSSEREKSISSPKTPPSFSKLFLVSVSDSVISVLNVTGIIVFFSAILYIFDIIKITSFLPDGFVGIFKGLFEMTSGIKMLCASMMPYTLKAAFSSFLISFSGISVFFQALSFNENIKIPALILSTLVKGILSMFICYAVMTLLWQS